MPITLFDDIVRIETRASYHNEDQYAYFNTNARPEIQNIRVLMESWYSRYPDDDKSDLKSRFQASFSSAFFELFVHEYFNSQGYALDVHPTLHDANTHPDYLVKKDGVEFYVEAKYIGLVPDGLLSHERRLNTLYDSLNKIDSVNYLLRLDEITFKGNSQPNGKRIVRFFNDIIRGVDPNELDIQVAAIGYDALSSYTYEDDLVVIKLRLIPKVKHMRGTISNAIGFYPTEISWGDDADNIKDALQRKASKYGSLDKPLLICLNKPSIGIDKIEIGNALFGSLAVSYSTNPHNRDERLVRGDDGLFGNRNKPKTTRLSAVMITNANNANLATTAVVELVSHPFAKHKLNIHVQTGLAKVFNISPNYPYSL